MASEWVARSVSTSLLVRPDDLMNLHPGKVRLRAQVGIADDVEVGEAGEAERLADAATSGGFEVDEGIGGIAWVAMKLKAEEERSHQ